ncbi:MAG: HpcH/HpaI aldolase/citrate lyase family protein [Desulfovibrio sp.]|nr:HpcH/HpaI aldolase/citrate lyase family protein [Desulfovibrio sp.]MBR5049856.1 HpcH/HpaI aldolase/citrate lyase family protein [Desulfovibrio sp.]MBR6467490.1 HpcH/HpaI aldolase/citrate lyase family protein [Desulfovibrio sp.]
MPAAKQHLFRTSLYASGASPVNMQQAVFYNEDCIVYDMEDSVPQSEKDAARFMIYNMLREHRPSDKHIQIRVNGLYTPYFAEDMQAAVLCRPDAIRVPKVESAEEVHKICARLDELEKAYGVEQGSIKIWCLIESHIGVLNAREIAGASERVEALVLGAEDFTASMHATRTKPGWEVFYARNMVLMACRAEGKACIDVVFSDINDLEGLKEDARMTKTMGFDGKTTIHPRQVDTVNAMLTPTQKEIRYAMRVLDAIREGEKNNKGAVSLDGNMLDVPVMLRARNVMALAKAAGLKIEGDYYDM